MSIYDSIAIKRADVALVCSSGGHLTQVRKIFTKEVIGNHSYVLITEKVSKKSDKPVNNNEIYFSPLKLNPLKNFVAMIKLMRIFKKLKVKMVITTGADIGTMAMLVGKIMGIKTMFIETVIRVKMPTLTGRMAYPFSDIFLVQHKGLEKKIGKRVIYKGGIL
jgi:UDP-N-acetylglucosamine:LPS N-acetylglucosamine transferase